MVLAGSESRRDCTYAAVLAMIWAATCSLRSESGSAWFCCSNKHIRRTKRPGVHKSPEPVVSPEATARTGNDESKECANHVRK